MHKMYNIGNGRAIVVCYDANGVAPITRECVEQFLVPAMKRDAPSSAKFISHRFGGEWHCSACNAMVATGDAYCHRCGQAIKWKG